MNKPEPLKGKLFLHGGDPKLDQHYEFCKKKDIRAAVEWLLEEVTAFEESKKVKMTYTDLKTLIKTAFKDVLKQKEGYSK